MENWKIIFEWVSVVFGGITGLTAIVFAIARIFGRNLIMRKNLNTLKTLKAKTNDRLRPVVKKISNKEGRERITKTPSNLFQASFQ